MSPRKVAVAVKSDVAVAPAGPALIVDNKLNFDALQNGERKTAEQFVTAIRQGLLDVKNSGLKIGEALLGAREMFEPRRAYGAFLNGIGMARSSANRYLNWFVSTSEGLPELILTAVIAAGIPMYGTKEQPYGRYTKIVNKLGLPHGILTAERARDWVQEVQAKYRAQQATARKVARTPEKLRTTAVRTLIRLTNRIPQEQKIAWFSEVVAEAAKNHGLQINVTVASPGAVAAEVEARPKARAAHA